MAVPGYVLKNRRTTLERLEKFMSPIMFTDVNLMGKLYTEKAPLKRIQHYAAPGRITYEEAINGTYEDTEVGREFGPTWSTHWFRVEIEIPESWVGEEVFLLWNCNSEAMIWKDGDPLQGITNDNRRNSFRLSKSLTKSELQQLYYVEMAANDVFGAGDGYQIAPPDENRYYKLSVAEIAVVDPVIWQLLMDLQVIYGLAKNLPENTNRAYQALYTGNEMVNVIDFNDTTSLQRAHEIAQAFFNEKNGQTQHTVYAVGNCHIDSAWLWPYAETIRKCARSFSSTVQLLQVYPDMIFVCPQAQQFEWVKTHYPTLYEKMKVYAQEGRFLPIGGTWSELDGNIPNGESFIRQFLLGQKFFEKEFGIRCQEFWLPDTFGYSAQIPQIMMHCGMKRFVTQKMSWNVVNKFPHNNFWWKGLDGTTVIAHFPPADSYTNHAEAREIIFNLDNFKDKGRSNHSLFLYGWGDGGQGPTAEMLERLQRMKDIDGLPKVEFKTPSEFFSLVEDHESDQLNVWQGELYLEMHNATYTTQCTTKEKNRVGELLLAEAEMLSSLALSLKGAAYPYDELLRVWKLFLLNQFHDVLPGTSIADVYKDAMEYYDDVFTTGRKASRDALHALLGAEGGDAANVVFSWLTWERSGVVELTAPETKSKKRAKKEEPLQVNLKGSELTYVKVPSFGYKVIGEPEDVPPPVTAIKTPDEKITMKNDLIEIVLDPLGRVTEAYTLPRTKNAIPTDQPANQFVMFDDVPLYWDAWDVMDYHLETRKPVVDVIQHAQIVEEGPLRAVVEVSLKISDTSYIRQQIVLDAGSPYVKFQNEVTWYESHKFLKAEFPLNVHASQCTYEVQSGYLQRANHFNTSWDWAKYEVCGHKWADFSEYDFGVALLNDNKYGWSCINNILRLSLVRAPKAPDANADMGVQKFTYALMPHNGTFQSAGVIQAAYELNVPLSPCYLQLDGQAPDSDSYLSISSPAVILQSLKKAEDSNNLVLRVYEAYGGRADTSISLKFPITEVKRCNGLEEPLDEAINLRNGEFSVTLRPFEIASFMLVL